MACFSIGCHTKRARLMTQTLRTSSEGGATSELNCTSRPFGVAVVTDGVAGTDVDRGAAGIATSVVTAVVAGLPEDAKALDAAGCAAKDTVVPTDAAPDTVEVAGVAVEVAGVAVEVAGVAVEVAGVAVEVAGVAVEVAGVAVEVAGVAVKVAGVAVEVAEGGVTRLPALPT